MENHISLNISKLVDKENLSKDAFGRLFDLKRGAISSYIDGKALPKIETLQKISARYKISIDELVNKEIDAKRSVNVSDISEIEPYESHAITIPLYNSEASAGIGQLQLNNEYVIDNLQVPFARENDIALTIVGDSMTPAMQSGDIAVVRNMPNWNDYLEFGNIFIVVTEHEVYCKVISKNEEKEIFTLKSYNSNYSEFEILKKFIRQVYKVIGIISQRSY
ncbi:hypothetical protein BZG02_10810 [Labilibaculum filiforme]|uniref:HTH cro/C1-type domain-containing protein n=1 Tax=Labilibaculum filiforme TaxID=1940526 RepID=A0A2N3HYT8_9BACT|nr:LexA family transcriptional regulator [Labilibaculum filiforme]PKQ63229.1 hypothetical protein BZG02_10810 [Labilibaculum filiforme]